MKKNFKDFDWLTFLMIFIVLSIFLYMSIAYCKEIEIEKEIIKQSDEYVIYKSCTEIQGNYYCK